MNSNISFTVSNASINALRAQRDAIKNQVTISSEEALQLAAICDLLFATRRAYHAARETRKALKLAQSK